MVKLETIYSNESSFFFYTMRDCKAFLHVFRDHWCNVPWKPPVEAQDFPEMPVSARSAMDKDPVKRAEGSLSWGFSLVKHHRIGATEKQNAFINSLIRQFDLHPQNIPEV